MQFPKPKLAHAVIIAPKSRIYTWSGEFEKIFGTLKPAFLKLEVEVHHNDVTKASGLQMELKQL